jgi:hypothetical protein
VINTLPCKGKGTRLRWPRGFPNSLFTELRSWFPLRVSPKAVSRVNLIVAFLLMKNLYIYIYKHDTHYIYMGKLYMYNYVYIYNMYIYIIWIYIYIHMFKVNLGIILAWKNCHLYSFYFISNRYGVYPTCSKPQFWGEMSFDLDPKNTRSHVVPSFDGASTATYIN